MKASNNGPASRAAQIKRLNEKRRARELLEDIKNLAETAGIPLNDTDTVLSIGRELTGKRR